MDTKEIKRQYDLLVSKKASLLIRDKSTSIKLREVRKQSRIYQEGREILNNSIKIIHQKFKHEIETIITRAIKQVFNRDLSLKLIYEEKRNGIDTRIVVEENGEELEPKDDLGGSILDIISISFRIIMWQMSSNKARNTFILDEPFKWTGKLSLVTGLILKELSKKFEFQVILVTHDENLIFIADKIFKVDHVNGISKIKTIRNRSK
jgi:DNA repair exonuclease SbcCD ATPase subunit